MQQWETSWGKDSENRFNAELESRPLVSFERFEVVMVVLVPAQLAPQAAAVQIPDTRDVAFALDEQVHIVTLGRLSKA